MGTIAEPAIASPSCPAEPSTVTIDHTLLSTPSLWLPVTGYQLPGVNAPGVPRPFTPIGTIDGSWHFAVVGGGGASLKNHPQVSNLGYQFVYPYPFFPGNVGYLCKSGYYVMKNRICVCVCVCLELL